MTATMRLVIKTVSTTLFALWMANAAVAVPGLSKDSTEVPDIAPLPPVEPNPDNAPTDARVALGRALFFDNRISATGTMNCATCHLPHQGWTVQTPL